ncbi:Ig-like domain-containing protein [Nitrosomonas sp.]|uniref:Ig-like domain-containing protein n=1 Tax=Nitrosomonas sp. TaxID=42353 RepID=UPI002632C0AC|nr:Ig-like domain-containing protein [Nitrosomonas sp.]
MIAYPPINYLNDLTIDQINSATPLTFTQYVPPINGFGDMLDWDFRALFSTSVNNTGARNMFAFEGTAGATYDLFSQSFFDPFVLQLFDEQGRVVATDDASGAAGTDHIRFTASYDGIYYLDASWRQGFADIDKYAAISVYEDLDTIPPTFPSSSPSVSVFSPTNSATDVAVDSNIVLTFSEAIQRGSGSIALVTAGNVLIESFDAASSSNLSLSDKTLTINPTNNLSNNTQYFVTLDSGSIKDLTGHGNAEVTSYSFITTAQTPDTNADRIFDWGERQYPDLFSDHPESQDVFGYHARIYSNGNALGEQNDHIYFYDGGTGDIILVGTTADFLPQAIAAGY